MIKSITSIICAVLMFSMASKESNAGPFSDTFAKCMILESTPLDKTKLLTWMFFAMTEHPALKSKVEISEWDKVVADKDLADLFTRLLFVKCNKEFLEANKYENEGAMQSAFSLLGSVAATEIMTHPEVNKALINFTKFMDEQKIRELTGVK